MNEKGAFAYFLIFDNGAGILADTTMDYPLDGDIYELIDSVKSKTISSDFEEQLDISEALYQNHIKFSFMMKDVKELLDNAEIYSEKERIRVERVIRVQMRKYQYLFEK